MAGKLVVSSIQIDLAFRGPGREDAASCPNNLGRGVTVVSKFLRTELQWFDRMGSPCEGLDRALAE